MTVTVDQIVQLRVGGLPVEVTRNLASPEARTWAEQVLAARVRIGELRQAASDELARYVGDAPDGLRKELVQIRRAVFNGRRTERAIKSLPDGLRTLVKRCVATVNAAEVELAELEESGRRSFDGWLISERRQLADLLEDEDFADGLAIAAPGVGRSLSLYSGKGVVAAPNKEMRKCERSLIAYAMRAAAKASPFSTFTPTALASFAVGEAGWEYLPARPRRHSRWNVYPVARTLGWLREDRHWLHGLHLRLSRTVRTRLDGSLDVTRSVYEYKDSHRAEDYATCQQTVVRLRHSEVCRIVTAVLAQGPAAFEDVVDELVGRAGLTPERAGDALARLVRLGFVEVDGLDLHPHTAHHAGTARQVLGALGDDKSVALVRALDRYEETAAVVSGTTGRSRTHAISEARHAVEDLYEAAGLEAPLPRTVVYEDCTLGQGIYRGPHLRWTEEECRALATLVAVLDTAQTDRALMRGYFMQVVGEAGHCTDVPAFLRSFDADLYDSHKTRVVDPEATLAEDPWLKWGDAWRWTEARRRLMKLMEECGEELDLLSLLSESSDLLDGLTIPRHRYQHLFAFAQLLPEGSAGSMVINRVFGQAGFGLSRFAYMHGAGGERVARDQEERARRAGVRLAEISGGTAFTNLNLHGPLLGAEIVQPGDPGGSQSVTRLNLDELVLEDRPEENRLVLLTRDGTEIQPAYLGYLILSATPVLTQMLSLLAPASNISFSVTPPLRDELTTRVLPRVRIGSLVLRRRTVQVATRALPDVDPATPDGYLQWLTWWKGMDLPERCYVSHGTDSERGTGKPRYLDVSGLVGLAAASHEWRGQEGWIDVAEALPDLDETVINRDGDHRIHELVLGFDLTHGTEGEY